MAGSQLLANRRPSWVVNSDDAWANVDDNGGATALDHAMAAEARGVPGARQVRRMLESTGVPQGGPDVVERLILAHQQVQNATQRVIDALEAELLRCAPSGSGRWLSLHKEWQ